MAEPTTLHPQSNTVPASVTAAQNALATSVAATFTSSDVARHQALATLMHTYTIDGLATPAAIAASGISFRRQQDDRRRAQLGLFLKQMVVRPTVGPNGVLENPLVAAANRTLEFVTPAMPNVNNIRLWQPNNTGLDLSRCFTGCGTNYEGLAVASTGGAYGLQMSWMIKGICLPAFANPQQAMAWFERNAEFSATVFNAQFTKMARSIVTRALQHKFTLEAVTDANGVSSYVRNSSPLAPASFGHYRHKDGLFVHPTDINKLAPLQLPMLDSLARYYNQLNGNVIMDGSIGMSANGTPSWAIWDSQPDGWLWHNIKHNPAFNTPNQQYQNHGTVQMVGGTVPSESFGPWNFMANNVFPGFGVNTANGSLIEIPDYVSINGIDPEMAKENGLIQGDVDALNPASRNPTAIQFTIAPSNVATIMEVAENWNHQAVGEDQNAMLHSGSGHTLPRPRVLGQIADIYDRFFEKSYLVVPNPNVDNATTGILARAQSLSAAPVNMCNTAAITYVAPATRDDNCPRDASFRGYLDERITGPAANRNLITVTEARAITTTRYAITVRTDVGQTLNIFSPLYSSGGALTVIYSDVNGVNSDRIAATVERGLLLETVQGTTLAPTGGDLVLVLSAALPAGSIIRGIERADSSPTGYDVVKGTVEPVIDAITDVVTAGTLFVQLSEMPTPAQWAQAAAKTLTTYTSAGAVIHTYSVTLTDTVNAPDGVVGRVQLSSASGNFTKALLDAAARINIA